jgi:hypothetical protein
VLQYFSGVMLHLAEFGVRCMIKPGSADADACMCLAYTLDFMHKYVWS